MKKLFLGLTIVTSIMATGMQAKAAEYSFPSANRTMPGELNADIAWDDSAADYTVTEDITYCYSQIQATLNAINAERKTVGLDVISVDQTATDAAMQRAAEISVCYSHNRPSASLVSYNDYVEGCGNCDGVSYVSWAIAAEKSTKGGHYNGFAGSYVKSVGIGIIKDSNGNYWTTIQSNDESASGSVSDTDKNEIFSCPISTNWFWGLALQDEYAALSTSADRGILKADHSNAANADFVAFTKSTVTLPVGLANYYFRGKLGYEWMYQNAYGFGRIVNINPSNVTFQSLNTDILTIDENGVMQGLKAGKATVRVTLKPQTGVTFKSFTTSSVDYTIEVLDGGIKCTEDNNPALLGSTSITKSFVSATEWDGASSADTTTTDTTDTIQQETVSTKDSPAEETTKTAETKKTTETKKTDNYKPAAPQKVKVSKKGKKVTVKYSSVYKASSYEIQVSKSKKFKSVKSVVAKKTNKTIKVKSSWAKKTMYVRVRAINGTKKSSWSAVKKIKK